MNILTVDFLAPDASERFVESLRNTGFAVIKNHPISIDLVNSVYNVWKDFYARDLGYKKQFIYDPENLNGYYPMDVSETAKGFDLPDIKEFYHYYPWDKRQPDGVMPTTHQLYSDMSALAGTLLSWIDAGTPKNIRDKFSMPLPEMITDCPRTSLRILHYPPFSGDEQPGAVRAAEHGDINLITLLPAATDSGLQVKDLKGNWHNVSCDFGTIAINAGDMLQECTQNYFPSTPHRVINPTGDSTQQSRLSLPLFLHPRDEVRLSDEYTAYEHWRQGLVIGVGETS